MSPKSSRPSSKHTAKVEAREKARLLREEEERRRRRSRAVLVTAAVVAVLAIVLVVGLVIRDTLQDSGGITADRPTGVTADGAVVVGDEDAPVTVDVYLDYQCPACKSFEEENATQLASLAQEGAAKIAYRPVSILDSRSGGYSTRAAGAAFCVAEAAPETFGEFTRTMFANQPAEGGDGLTDVEMTTIATLAGAPESVGECIEEERYTTLATQATRQAQEDGMPGTPWVKVNGEPLENWSADNLAAAVSDALRAEGGLDGEDAGTPSTEPTTPTTD